MSALARYFLERGCCVSGYDRTPSALTRQLEEEGVAISYEDEVKAINRQTDLVIYTPAIGTKNTLYKYFIDQQFSVFKRSEVLQMILREMKCIAVAGTHGKTTISSMIAHILRDSGLGCYAFLGGITVNYDTNYWSSNNSLAVVEADEYDRSFLRLNPDKAVVTAMDADHLDIYQTETKLQEAFIEFTGNLKPGGLLIYKENIKRSESFSGDRKWSYSMTNDQAAVFARNIKPTDGSYQFEVVLPNKKIIENLRLNIGGRHNVENAVAAIAVAFDLGIEPTAIRKALASFKGVKRRFEYLINMADQVYVDDYAHHPEELEMLLSSVKELYPGEKCTVIFQPHLYSRTRDLAAEFAKALNKADKVILLPVYPAREDPIPGVSSQLIVDLLEKGKGTVCSKQETLKRLKGNKNKVVVTAGAGDIGLMAEEVKACLENKKYKKKHVG